MRWKFLTLAAAILVLICVIIIVTLRDDNSSRQTLADGTVIILSEPLIGRTNVYTHGTLLSKTIGRFGPKKGFVLGKFKLERPVKMTFPGPEGSEIFSAQLRLLPGSPREKSLVSPPFFRKYRLLIYGDNDFAFVREFDGFKKEADGLFAQVWAWSFPRDSRQLHLRLEERDSPTNRDWHEVTTFAIRNPKPAQIEPWLPQELPRLKLSEDLEAQIGELTVHNEPHPADIWGAKALLPIQITSHDGVATNWGIHSGPIWDASGNLDYFTFGKVITNDWMVYQDFRPLDPTKPWRFQVSFALDSNFPATNLFQFIVPWPLKGTIQTNLGGFPARISIDKYQHISVELVNKPADIRLTLVAAADDYGRNLDDGSGSWGQHHFYRSLKLSKQVQIHVTVAIHRNYKAEFTLQPRYEKPLGHIQAEGMQPAQQTR